MFGKSMGEDLWASKFLVSFIRFGIRYIPAVPFTGEFIMDLIPQVRRKGFSDG